MSTTVAPAAPGLLNDRLRGTLAACVVVLCWSGFNIVSRFGSKGIFTPFDLAAMRFGVSGAIALPFFVRWVPWRQWPRYLAIALLGGVGYGVLVYSGFAFAPTAHAGVFVNGGIPFWTIVLVTALSGWHIQRPVLIALCLSLAGLVLISYDSLVSSHAEAFWIGDLLFLTAALSWAVFGLLMRRWQLRPHFAIFGLASFSSVLYLPVYLLWLPKTIAAAPAFDIGLQCVYQGIIAALLAGVMYSYANQKIGATSASMMLALVPGVSAAAAAPILGEALNATIVAGIVLVSLGAILGALPPQRVQSLLDRLAGR
ncbi:EamA family transporter [Denitratisoma sp. agr-D3]